MLIAQIVSLNVVYFQRAQSTQQLKVSILISLKVIQINKTQRFLSPKANLDMIHHVAGRGGHVAGLTHVVLVLGQQPGLSLLQIGLLGDLVLVQETFTVAR